MRRWYATSHARINQRDLRISIENLCKRVLKFQAPKTNYLHDTVRLSIDKYYVPLTKHFGLYGSDLDDEHIKEEIWKKLSTVDEKSEDLLSRRHGLLSAKNRQYRAPQIPYNNFIKALYPQKKKGSLGLTLAEHEYSSFVGNAIKYELINHDLVYRCYCELPHPATSYMKPNHLDDFLSRFLYRRDFIKPNKLSSSYTRSADVTYSTYNEMIQHRNEHISMCTKILNDMKESELPLTVKEQNQFIFMSFYRDRADVMEKVTAAIKELAEIDDQNTYTLNDKNNFDLNIYRLIKAQLESDQNSLTIETYNTLLFVSMRHEQHGVIKEILKDIGLQNLVNVTNQSIEETTTTANRETIELLLDYFSSPAFRNISDNDLSAFLNTINYLTNSKKIVPDIRTINKITKGLANMKHIEEAEFLVSNLFIDPLLKESGNTLLDTTNSVLSIYKGLTPDDKNLYKKFLQLYENLSDILSQLKLENLPYKLIPNEGSFRPLIYSYCSPNNDPASFQKSMYMMSVIEDQGLPITTRIFHALFSKFIEFNKHRTSDTSNWNLEELNHVTLKLIDAYDKTSNLRQDILMKNKVEELLVSAQLKSFVNNNLNNKGIGYIPNERGRFVKLSDSIIHQVCRAYFTVLNNDPSLTLSQKKEYIGNIDLLRQDVLNDIKRIRASEIRDQKQMVFINEEINYIKKGFLIDLIDETYAI